MTPPPDQRRFQADIQDGPFLAGVADGRWGRPDDIMTAGIAWPQVLLWVAAAARNGSPDRFYLLLDCQGYPGQGPTGAFWDSANRCPLPAASWPKGKGQGQVAAVFRPDWEGGRALYHPFDRVTAGKHADWPAKYPHLLWDGRRTILDLLGMVHGLLNCNDYQGV